MACVLAGVAFRFLWAAWDEGASFHPDEYSLTRTLSRLGWPRSPGEWFNTRLSPLSPYQKYEIDGSPAPVRAADAGMRWGQWPKILVRGAAEGLNGLPWGGNRKFTGFQEIRLLGRHLSAAADSLVLLLLYWTGRRLAGRRTALLAAALYALAALPIQQSHFLTVDPLATLFSTVAVALAASAALPGGSRPRGALNLAAFSLAFGAASGMAVASRLNLVPLLGLLPLALLLVPPSPDGNDGAGARVGRAAGAAFLALAAAVLVFRVTQPMSFRAAAGETSAATWSLNPDWTRNVALARAESSGDAGGPPAEQWTSRTRLVFPFVNVALWGLGPLLGLAGFLSLAWASARLVRPRGPGRNFRLAVPVVWAGGFFLFMGTRWVSSVRYFLPIVPWLALLAAWGVLRGTAAVGKRRSALRRLARVLPCLVLAGTAAWAWAYTGVYRQGNPRLAASRWIFANIPTTLNAAGSGPAGPFEERLQAPEVLTISPGSPYSVRVKARHTGTLRRIFSAHPSRREGGPDPEVRVTVLGGEGVRGILAEGRLASPLGVEWEAGREYEVRLTVRDGEAVLSSSVLAGEHWDEVLPASLDGHPAKLYRRRLVEVRGADTERKRTNILERLEEADAVVLSSQRAVWTVPRLPNNYPLTLLYYRALFDGRLGFAAAPASPFQVPLVLGPLRISDLAGTCAIGADPPLPVELASPVAAEEAFSVYDHPPVWVFRKTARFDAGAARALLSSVDLSAVVAQTPRQATESPGLLMISPARWARQAAGGTWSRMFDSEGLLNRRAPAAVTAWYFLFLLAGALALPLACAAFPGLPDRGALLAKPLALLVVGWTAWLLPALDVAPFGRVPIAAGAVVLAGLSGFVLSRRRAELGSFVRKEWRSLAACELLFALLFAFGLFVRWKNPDLWHPWMGGEKPMAVASLNAVLRSTSFPPYDPWFSGGILNYPYFGYVLAAVPTRLLGIAPSVAYNLVLPTLFAFAGCGVFSVAAGLAAGRGARGGSGEARASIRGKVAAGAGAVVLLLLIGNLAQPRVIGQAVHGGQGTEITEFPFFTFLHGDLDPHFMALPLGLVALAFALSLFRSGGSVPPLAWGVGGLVLGAVRVTNPWDFPAQAALALVALWAVSRAREFAWRAAILLGAGFVLFRPFDAGYVSPHSSATLSSGPFTSLAGTLSVHGLFLLAGAAFLLSAARRADSGGAAAADRPWTWGRRALVASFLLVESLLLLRGVSGAWVLWPLLAAGLAVALGPGEERTREERAVALLFAAGAALALGAEVIAVGGDRTSTLFELSVQAWTFFSAASGAALAGLWRDRMEIAKPLGRAWLAAFVLLLCAAGLYTVSALPAWISNRFPGADGKAPADAPAGLDGFAFTLAEDAAAIDWMNRNVRGTPVIVEAQTPEHSWGSRYSVYTGLPTVAGWSWHTRQHRAGVPGGVVTRREEEVASFYATTEDDEAIRFLRRYGVGYVVAGTLEARLTPPEGLAKFDRMAARGLLSIAYRAGGVTLYEVRFLS